MFIFFKKVHFEIYFSADHTEKFDFPIRPTVITYMYNSVISYTPTISHTKGEMSKWTNHRTAGLISEDRSNKGYSASYNTRFPFKSSASDLLEVRS